MMYDEKPYTPDPTLPEDLARRPVKHPSTYPHCDSDVVHTPGACYFCDQRPDRQVARFRERVAFTGEPAPDGGAPCPSDARRGQGGAHVWGGNRPTG